MQMLMVATPDHRGLEVLRAGPEDAPPLLFHFGTPGAAVEFPQIADEVLRRGWQFIGYSRPGYGDSTANQGRSVADAAPDVVAILDHLGHDTFVTVGWSGGGPHALACAALLPERCLAAATIASVAPYDADGLDWFAGMAPESRLELAAALESRAALTAYLEAAVPRLAIITGKEIAAELGGLVDEVDRRALSGDFADVLAALSRRAVATGIEGWRDDDLAFVRPWGFDVTELTAPLSIWQGFRDRMVPFDHGRWLASRIPTATSHLYDDEGHLSIVHRIGQILEELDAAGRRRGSQS